MMLYLIKKQLYIKNKKNICSYSFHIHAYDGLVTLLNVKIC
jgi:hypothetical protein